MTNDSIKVRARFEKKGRAKYISHLDLNRAMQRAFTRSKLPIWFTQGFNPHPYLMFPLPLSLGYDSSVELMDFALNIEMDYSEIRNAMNAVLPEGLKIVEVMPVGLKHTEIGFAEYRITVISNEENLLEQFNDFISQEIISVKKRTKKKTFIDVDIKPIIDIKEAYKIEGGFEFLIMLPSGTEKNYNPSLVLDEFFRVAEIEPIVVRTERLQILCHNKKVFL